MLLQNILVLLLFTLYSMKSSLDVKHRREVKPKSMAETGPNAHVNCVSQKNDSIPLFRDLSMQSVEVSLNSITHKTHIYYISQKNNTSAQSWQGVENLAPLFAGCSGSPVVTGCSGSPVVTGCSGSPVVTGCSGSSVIAGCSGSSVVTEC